MQKRNLKAQIQVIKGKHVDKYRKKLEEQEVAYWVASPSLPLRLYGRAGKVDTTAVMYSVGVSYSVLSSTHTYIHYGYLCT